MKPFLPDLPALLPTVSTQEIAVGQPDSHPYPGFPSDRNEDVCSYGLREKDSP